MIPTRETYEIITSDSVLVPDSEFYLVIQVQDLELKALLVDKSYSKNT